MSDPFRVTATARLQPGREASVLRGHPWIYSGALADARPAGVAAVRVVDANGHVLGVALAGSSGGSLALRMVAWGEERWGAELLRRRLAEAVALRDRLAIDSDAMRLVHAEGDGLGGLVVDRYGDTAVLEVYEPAWQPVLGTVVSFLTDTLRVSGVLLRRGYERRSTPEPVVGPLPAAPVVIREGRARLPVDLVRGQKTGFFLDQRENRRRLGEVSRGATVLNLFSYSGAFAIAALLGGARRAVNVDASRDALGLARQAYALNDLEARDEDFLAGDAFTVARELASRGERFDLVVVDPPAFVRRRAELEGGLRGYKDVNLQALRLVAPGGLLLTCSCSALVDEEAFGGALLAAAVDAGRTVRILERRSAAPDHPVALACPESRHLKAWLCEVRARR